MKRKALLKDISVAKREIDRLRTILLLGRPIDVERERERLREELNRLQGVVL
jgi:hypothetical protein